MGYLYFKALHIVFMVTWFAGLFYIIRLFIYQHEALGESNEAIARAMVKKFKVMAYRLWYIIAWPSMLLTLFFGVIMLPIWWGELWMMIKLIMVGLLVGYHLFTHRIFLDFQRGNYRYSSLMLRFFNEGATIFLIAIVFLAVLKRIEGLWAGILVFVVFGLVLIFAVLKKRKMRK